MYRYIERLHAATIEVFVYCFMLAAFVPRIGEGDSGFGYTILMAIDIKSLVDTALAYYEATHLVKGTGA